MANHFVLRHRELTVTYDAGRNPALTALGYDDDGYTDDFKPADITTNQTALGELVSVPLRKSIDTGGETFGFFLPEIDVPLGECVEFTTAGIYARYSGPDSFPHRPQAWHAIELYGSAESVEEPL
jgi:hypothetical protein